jgi:hypothetical protein
MPNSNLRHVFKKENFSSILAVLAVFGFKRLKKGLIRQKSV